jgi:DNA-binding response OmpR family regulator
VRGAPSAYRGKVLIAQDVRVDPSGRQAWRSGEVIELTRKEFDLLHALIARAGQLVTREELMRDVWHTEFWSSSKTLDVHLGWLRRKLGDDPRNPTLITTVRGRGLRFEAEAPVLEAR